MNGYLTKDKLQQMTSRKHAKLEQLWAVHILLHEKKHKYRRKTPWKLPSLMTHTAKLEWVHCWNKARNQVMENNYIEMCKYSYYINYLN